MLTERLSAKIERQPAPEKVVLWNSERYFSARILTEIEQSAREQQVLQDLTSFFDEYSFLRAAVSYPYGPTGMRQGYTEKVSEITANFMHKMEEDGKPIARAQAEVAVARAVEDWMQSHPFEELPERIICMSPRGTPEELYPGLQDKNYVFINIFEKDTDGFVLRQYRSYDKNNQLPAVQQQLAQLSPQAGHLEQLNRNAHAHSDHQTITTLVHLPTTVPLTQIEDILYARKKQWSIDIDRELPQVPSALRMAELSRTTAYCLNMFRELSANTTLKITDKQTQFTELVMLVRQALLKWTEDHASNYHPDAQLALQYHLNLELLTETWNARIKKKAGTELEAAEQHLLQQFSELTRLNPVLPLKGAASWAHCISGTPQSLLLKGGMRVPGITGSANVFEFRSMLGQLSAQEKNELAESLKHYARISVGGEIWYVPGNYLDEPGCTFDDQTGLVVGPCGIPLREDPLAYTAEQYEQLQAELADSPEEILSTLSGETQTRITTLTSWLVRELFVSTATIDRILLGDILKAEHQILKELLPLRAFFFRSTNPLSQVLWYVLTLSERDEHDGIEKLEQLMRQRTTEQSVVAGQEILLFSANQLV